ncbi:acyl-CoA thioesterase [Roseomonas mucosa]
MVAHRHPITIEWADCDPAGIVYYPRYLAMFDSSTMALFQARLGMKKAEWLRHYDIVGIPMVDTRTRFLIPSTYGDEVVVESEVVAISRSSLDIHHRLLREGDKLAAEGFDTRVWAGRHPEDPTRIKSRAIPADVAAYFGFEPPA